MSKTIAEAITALAAKVKGSAVTPADGTKVAALDALVDAMAGSDVPMPQWSTVAEAIDLVTANYTPGGGGVDLGPLGFVFFETSAPEVGVEYSENPAIFSVSIGDVAVSSGEVYGAGDAFAAGTTLQSRAIAAASADSCTIYVCGFDSVTYKYTSVAEWDGTVTRIDTTLYGDPAYAWKFIMPELQDGTVLAFVPYLAG